MLEAINMDKNKVFSQEELEAMGARTLDLLQESIEAGDKEMAKKLAQRMYNEFSRCMTFTGTGSPIF